MEGIPIDFVARHNLCSSRSPYALRGSVSDMPTIRSSGSRRRPGMPHTGQMTSEWLKITGPNCLHLQVQLNQTVWPVIFGLTGPICARALNPRVPRELSSRGHQDWPVKRTSRKRSTRPCSTGTNSLKSQSRESRVVRQFGSVCTLDRKTLILLSGGRSQYFCFAKNSRMAWLNSFGFSSIRKWPVPGICW